LRNKNGVAGITETSVLTTNTFGPPSAPTSMNAFSLSPSGSEGVGRRHSRRTRLSNNPASCLDRCHPMRQACCTFVPALVYRLPMRSLQEADASASASLALASPALGLEKICAPRSR
jgi:hypothetical protein